MRAADIVLVRSTGLFPWLIRLGEALRGRDGARWNHVAVLDHLDAHSQWTTIEAEGHGVVRRRLADHPDHLVVETGLDDEDRAEALAFLRSCLGAGYGYLTIVSIALDLLTPSPLVLRSKRTLICSELAARTLEHGGWVAPELDVGRIMPSDLARWLVPAR